MKKPMSQAKAVKIALDIMKDAARKKYQFYLMFQQGFEDQKNQAERYTDIVEAIEIIETLGKQLKFKI